MNGYGMAACGGHSPRHHGRHVLTAGRCRNSYWKTLSLPLVRRLIVKQQQPNRRFESHSRRTSTISYARCRARRFQERSRGPKVVQFRLGPMRRRRLTPVSSTHRVRNAETDSFDEYARSGIGPVF
jgi:hypothetical protein